MKTGKAHWIEFKNTVKATSDLYRKACRNTKRISTIQFARDGYHIGIIDKTRYIAILEREANTLAI